MAGIHPHRLRGYFAYLDRAIGNWHKEVVKEAVNKLIPFMVRQAHRERNQLFTVRPEPVEGLVQSFPNYFEHRVIK